MEHTLRAVRLTKPDVTQVFYRSDNAGCYHCGFLILSLSSLGKRTGVEVVRYDFSEPQAGKDVCDRRIAAMKSHMRRFINEGNNVQTAQDMKNALDSYGGVKGCYVAVAEVNDACQSMTKHSMVGVQAFNNFAFDSAGVRVWKAYDVGPGKLYTNAQLMKMGPPQGPTKMKIVQDFVNPDQEVGALLNPRKQLKTSTREDDKRTTSEQQKDVLDDEDPPVIDREEEMIFSCPEEGCVKKYVSFSNLQKHLDVGKHFLKLERECRYDEIKRKWAETCGTTSSSGYVHIGHHQILRRSSDSGQQSATDTSHPSADEGWAAKKTRKSTRFSERVKLFLRDIFLTGQDTGKKANPTDISSKMKNLRSESGRKVFGKDEWLTTQQVASYFSRLAALNKSGRLLLGSGQAEVPSEEDDSDLRHERDEMACQVMRDEIRRQIEL